MSRALFIGGAVMVLTLASALDAAELQFADLVHAHDTMSGAEWEGYEKTVTGQQVCWTGTVVDVDRQLLGGYQITADMGHTHVPQVFLKDLGKDAARYVKGDKVSWCGTIESVHGILGVNVTFREPSLK